MWRKLVRLKWYGKPTYHPLDLASVPQEPGVYKLHRREYNGEWTIFHVAEADKLYEALQLHLTSSERNEKILESLRLYDCAFSYAIVPDPAERDAILKYLYETYQPDATDPNSIPAEVEPLQVNAN